jgi:hypothetical protein
VAQGFDMKPSIKSGPTLVKQFAGPRSPPAGSYVEAPLFTDSEATVGKGSRYENFGHGLRGNRATACEQLNVAGARSGQQQA